MKLKYRIKKINFPSAESVFIAQYKIIGMWLNINDREIGEFFTSPRSYCETFYGAKCRINLHIENMRRAKNWQDKKISVVWKSNLIK
jgi:hypothetical protein